MKYKPVNADSPVNLSQSKLLATVIKPIIRVAKRWLICGAFQVQ
jgi:hypothetical protein